LKVACDVTRPDNLSGLVTSQATFKPISGRSADRRRVLLRTLFHYFFSSFKWLSHKKMVKNPIVCRVMIVEWRQSEAYDTNGATTDLGKNHVIYLNVIYAVAGHESS